MGLMFYSLCLILLTVPATTSIIDFESRNLLKNVLQLLSKTPQDQMTTWVVALQDTYTNRVRSTSLILTNSETLEHRSGNFNLLYLVWIHRNTLDQFINPSTRVHLATKGNQMKRMIDSDTI